MTYFGCKAYGHDAAIFSIDCDTRRLSGLSLERYSRVKRDCGHVALMADLWPDLRDVAFAFGSQNEFMALREVLPLEMGLLEHPVRSVIKHPHLSATEKLEQAGEMREAVAAWLRVESCLTGDLKYRRVSDEFWSEITRRRLPQLGSIRLCDHHLCHAASTYYHCGFPACAVVTLDGWGDNCFSKVFYVKDGHFTQISASELTWTWGYLYSKITRILGLFDNADEGKVEALASYGEPHKPVYNDWMSGYAIRNLAIHGSRERLAKYWQPGTLERLRDEIGEKDLAATVQTFLQDKAVEYVSAVVKAFGPNVAFAGGIFANVKMNQAIFEGTGLERMYVVPAMNDSGSAQGAAYLAAGDAGEDLHWLADEVMPYWGPRYDESCHISANAGIKVEKLDQPVKKVVDALCDGKVVALFQGAHEFGPRALGNRSILAAGTGGERIKDRINNLIKKREWYQPFCPAVLESERERLFVRSYPNKHMTCAFTLRDEHFEQLQAVAHIDKTARPQFVELQDNPMLYEILLGMKQRTGYGVVLNTSFNLHGRAMVLTPDDAVRDFVDCNLDALCLNGNWVTQA